MLLQVGVELSRVMCMRQPEVDSPNPIARGADDDGYEPEKFGPSCCGSAQTGVPAKVAVNTVVVARLNGPHVPVPLHEALPEEFHPAKVKPEAAVAVQVPIPVPGA